MQMIEDFLRKQDVDFAMLQEVTPGANINFRGYQSYENLGTTARGTAILTKVEMPLNTIRRIRSGRGIMAYYGHVGFRNIYAPSGSANRKEREDSFNTGIMDLLPHTLVEMLMDGDFNCVLSNRDSTGQRTSSRTLERLVQGLRLKDAWEQGTERQVYTHYTTNGAARLDRIYLTEGLYRNKQGKETIAVAFSDHMAVLLRIDLSIPFVHRGRGRWQMNTSFLKDRTVQQKISETWEECREHMHRYPDMVKWWAQYVKRKIQTMFIWVGTERNTDRRQMENYYYAVIYDLLQAPIQHADRMTALKEIKVKIIRLNSNHRQRITLDATEEGRQGGRRRAIIISSHQNTQKTEQQRNTRNNI